MFRIPTCSFSRSLPLTESAISLITLSPRYRLVDVEINHIGRSQQPRMDMIPGERILRYAYCRGRRVLSLLLSRTAGRAVCSHARHDQNVALWRLEADCVELIRFWEVERHSGQKRYWYAGCVSRRGELTFAPVESPAPLYAAAAELFGREPGTLMALASACPTQIEFDVQSAAESIRLPGGRVPPQTVAMPFVRSIAAEAGKQLVGCSLTAEFTVEEHLCSAVMTVVQQCCEIIAMRNTQRLCEHPGVRPHDSYLLLSAGFDAARTSAEGMTPSAPESPRSSCARSSGGQRLQRPVQPGRLCPHPLARGDQVADAIQRICLAAVTGPVGYGWVHV